MLTLLPSLLFPMQLRKPTLINYPHAFALCFVWHLRLQQFLVAADEERVRVPRSARSERVSHPERMHTR